MSVGLAISTYPHAALAMAAIVYQVAALEDLFEWAVMAG